MAFLLMVFFPTFSEFFPWIQIFWKKTKINLVSKYFRIYLSEQLGLKFPKKSRQLSKNVRTIVKKNYLKSPDNFLKIVKVICKQVNKKIVQKVATKKSSPKSHPKNHQQNCQTIVQRFKLQSIEGYNNFCQMTKHVLHIIFGY